MLIGGLGLTLVGLVVGNETALIILAAGGMVGGALIGTYLTTHRQSSSSDAAPLAEQPANPSREPANP